MELKKVRHMLVKEIANYYPFPLLEVLLIIMTISPLVGLGIFNLEYGGTNLSFIHPSTLINEFIASFFVSFGNPVGFQTWLISLLSALSIAGAFEKGEVITLLSYPIRRTEFLLIKILAVLIIGTALVLIPIITMMSIFEITSIMAIGLLGLFLTIIEVVALSSFIALTTKRILLAVLMPPFILLFLTGFSSNIKCLRAIIYPTETLMNYFYPTSLPIGITTLQDVVLAISGGPLFFIVCILLSIWYVRSMEVK